MDNFYDIFTEISKPFYEGRNLNNEHSKEVRIINLLNKYGAHYVDSVGIIVPSITESPSKIVVSHADLVTPFMRGFAKGKDFYLEDDVLRGALDNTITNSFLILAILELREQGLAQDVEFLFTEGEESGLTGMRNYMKKIFPLRDNPFFINLDVTNDNWGYSGSIEFDYPNKNICKQIKEAFPNKNGFTSNRFTDDTSAILSMGGDGFSFCIPTQNYCHTYNSFTLIEYLEPYYETLKYLIADLDTSNYSHDLDFLSNDTELN